MRAVNLLPRDAKRANGNVGQNVPAIVAACAGVLVVALLAGMYLLENSKVASAQRDLDAAKTELAATPVPPAAPRTLSLPPAVAAAQQPLLAAVSNALSQRIAWDRILREFSLVLPTDVWLSSLTLTTPPPGPLSGTGVSLTGTTYSYDSVARLLSRLSLVPDLGGVTLSSTSRSGRLIQFTVTAGVKGAPATPTVAPPPATTTTSTTPGASS